MREFFTRDVLDVAPDILGKKIVTPTREGIITEVEEYRDEEDLASHARFGLTKRNKVMYEKGGLIYVYFIYGRYWLLNIVTGSVGEPQAVLIRGVEGINGPGKVGQWLILDGSFYGEDVTKSNRIWLDGYMANKSQKVKKTPRIGVDYAGKWAQKLWRWTIG